MSADFERNHSAPQGLATRIHDAGVALPRFELWVQLKGDRGCEKGWGVPALKQAGAVVCATFCAEMSGGRFPALPVVACGTLANETPQALAQVLESIQDLSGRARRLYLEGTALALDAIASQITDAGGMVPRDLQD